MRRFRAMRPALEAALVFSLGLSTACMGMVYKRESKIPRRERNPHVAVVPRIDLTFECSKTREGSPAGADPSHCLDERKALDKVLKEFAYLARASEGAADPEYRLVVRVKRAEDYTISAVEDEACGYMVMMLMPCITREKLSVTAGLFTRDGAPVASAEASAQRVLFSHLGLIWAWPVGIPWWPSAVRFTTNTYRDVLAEIGKAIATRPPRNR